MREQLSAQDKNKLKEELSLHNMLLIFLACGAFFLVLVFGWDTLFGDDPIGRLILLGIPSLLLLFGCFVGGRMRLDLLRGKKNVFNTIITNKTSTHPSPNKVGGIQYFLHCENKTFLVDHHAYSSVEVGYAVEIHSTLHSEFVLWLQISSNTEED